MSTPDYASIPSLECLFNKYGWPFAKKYSTKQCLQYHRDVCAGIDYRGTDIIKYSQEYPARTPFVLAFIAPPECGIGWTFRVIGLRPVSAKLAKNLENQLRRHVATRIIPRGGRSVLKESPSRYGILTKHTKLDDGKYKNIPVVCLDEYKGKDKCEGIFKPNTMGEYICQECGIIHEYHDTSEEIDLEDTDDFERGNESDYFDVMQSTDRIVLDNVVDDSGTGISTNDPDWMPYYAEQSILGGQPLKGAYGLLDARVNRAIIAWKESLEIVPQDELETRKRLHDQKVRHEYCKKLNRNTDTISHQNTIYWGKWRELQARARLAKIISLVKLGIKDTLQLRDRIDSETGHTNFYRDLKLLEEKGRIWTEKDGRRQYIHLVNRHPEVATPEYSTIPNLGVLFNQVKSRPPIGEKPSVYTLKWWYPDESDNPVYMH